MSVLCAVVDDPAIPPDLDDARHARRTPLLSGGTMLTAHPSARRTRSIAP